MWARPGLVCEHGFSKTHGSSTGVSTTVMNVMNSLAVNASFTLIMQEKSARLMSRMTATGDGAERGSEVLGRGYHAVCHDSVEYAHDARC